MALVEDRYVTTTQTTDSNVAFLGQSSLVDVESIESPMGDMGTTVSISENPIAEIPRPEPLPDIKNIMITGGNGFLGYWMLRTLALIYPDSYKIVSFDNLCHGRFARNTESLRGLSNFYSYQGDITSAKDLNDCIERHQIDTIIHLAAQSHTADSFANRASCVNSNVQGTVTLLDRANAAGVQRFIFMSSGQVYDGAESSLNGFSEQSPLAPINIYSGSKAAAEMLVMAFGRSLKMKTTIVRCCNVYGPNQYPEKVIPKFTMLLKRGHKLPLNGTEEHSRRYIYVTDVVNALNAILHYGQSGSVYNLCSEEEVSNQVLCAHLVNCIRLSGHDMGADVSCWIDAAPQKKPLECGALMDCSKLRLLGWRPLVSMEDGLRKTTDWYMEHGDSWWGNIDHVISPRN